jgi:hypothetical protein
VSSEPIPQEIALRLQLAAIAGNEPGTSVTEIRPLDADGRIALLERAFLPVREFEEIASRVRELANTHNVFISAAPRTRHSGRADAVARCWCLWADCDTTESVEALLRFQPSPSLIVQTRPGRLHAWWPLRHPIAPAWAKRANQRLARALDSDRQAVDAARILRPVGSLNHKTCPPSPVVSLRLELDVYLLADVVGHLPDLEGLGYARPAAATPTAPGRPDAVLDGLCRKIREAQPPMFGKPGERNALLYWAACRLREHADAGTLNESEGREALRQAALAAGLGDVEIERTLDSALARRAAA